MAMMAITTSSSISVKPRHRLRLRILGIDRPPLRIETTSTRNPKTVSWGSAARLAGQASSPHHGGILKDRPQAGGWKRMAEHVCFLAEPIASLGGRGGLSSNLRVKLMHRTVKEKTKKTSLSAHFAQSAGKK